MRVREIMTKYPIFCTPQDTALMAALEMADHGVGALPVISDRASRKLQGMVTDRDLCKKVVAEGRDPKKATVALAMTANPVTCEPDTTVEQCAALMQKKQVRRIPVVNEFGKCVGIVAQADLARHLTPAESGVLLAAISMPQEQSQSPALRLVAIS